MNRAITIIYRGGKPSVLTGPEVPIQEQTHAFKTIIQKGIEGVEMVELWTSAQGQTKRKRFPVRTVEKAKAPAPKQTETAETGAETPVEAETEKAPKKGKAKE